MKIISTFTLMFTIAIATCIYSCSTTSALYNTEKLSPNGYAAYKTYAFLPTADTAYAKTFDKKRLEKLMSTAAIKELSKKGMQLDTANPDCFFTYKLALNRDYKLDEQQDVEYNPNVFTPAFDNAARIYTFSSNNRPVVYSGKYKIDTLRAGSMVIDMIDTKKGNVIWRSTAEGTTKETYQQPTEAAVNSIIHNMFKKFPRR